MGRRQRNWISNVVLSQSGSKAFPRLRVSVVLWPAIPIVLLNWGGRGGYACHVL